MKFLHTSDWHVGRTIRNRSRQDEHRDVFAEIIDIARQEHVDAVLVTGDIFHERRPSLEAQELVAETLAELACAQIPSVVIPGNHDDPGLLRTLKPLGDLVRVHIVSDFSEDLASQIIPIVARDGKEKALLGCLPYLHPHLVLSAAEGAGTSEDARLSAYQSKVQDYFRALPVNAGFLPAHVQYVALGHLHKPQSIPGAKAQARYAGSILQMDFGERDQKKSVCLIEAHPGKPAAVSQIELSKGKWLLRRTGTAEEILAQAQDFADAWVEVILQPDRRAAELRDRIGALPGVVRVLEESQVTIGKTGEAGNWGTGDRPATELFSDYYKTKRKTDPDPELMALFARLYQEESTAGDEPS